MQLESFLERSARRFPEKTAVVCAAHRHAYAEIDALANRFAWRLIEAGVERGDRVVIQLDNSVEAVVSVFGALKAGAVFVVLNPTTKPGKLALILGDCRPRALVTDAARWPDQSGCLAAAPDLRLVAVAGATDADLAGVERGAPFDRLLAATADRDRPLPKRCIDIDLAALIYTSGSTGRPKGVMMTHRNMVAAATSINEYLGNTADDVIFNVLPLSFDYGLYQVLMAFQVGATVVLERSFVYFHRVLERIREERATGFPLVPTIATILLRRDLRRYDLTSLRYITNTGAALAERQIRALRRSLPRVRIFSMYGLTECKRVSFLDPDQIDRRPGSVGKAMPNVEVYLVDPNGKPTPAGQVGELVVRGANVMQGYWRRPEETDRVLRPGRVPGERVLYTGDLFRMDREGFLYFVGRSDDMIKTRGEKVSPREVENVLLLLDGVEEAVAIGVPDELLGQAVKVFVVPKPGAVLSEGRVLRHCSRHLEDFMLPRHVEVRARLPRTASAKIDRRALDRAARPVPRY